MAKRKEPKKKVQREAFFSTRFATDLADQVAKTVMERLPKVLSRRKSGAKKKKDAFENPLFLDTSAIIDGRILEVARLGFLTGTIVVPEFILSELKHIADSEEQLRRSKGRRGLDVLNEFKKIKGIKLKILDQIQISDGAKEIDDKLLSLSKQYKGKLITSDFNLNKKAKVLGIAVLNVNELANVLKTVALPGEEFSVSIIAPGKGRGQGVGYLPDGTMVVVEEGALHLDKTVLVIVSRTIQTAAGRMLFTKVKDETSS